MGQTVSPQRRQAIREAYRQLMKDGQAVCVCGQLFLTEDGYADHVEQCEHVKRGEVAAQGKVAFEKE